ncbi:hypothetical protein CAL28_17160 [Bordetella genomosp. 11]|uniref:Lipoprotein n=1 Tax=Bordetella genomosp. 11 TaxID=1416808 RepID=A0A261UGM2_9BORD|nr:hypothetical protein CAL28_17160 [Bordetella genomosp. 11]
MTAFTIAVLLAGCTTGKTTRAPDAPEVSSHQGPVCFLSSALPADVKAKKIGDLESKKESYGGMAKVIQAAADEARRSGADVVANFQTGHRVGFGAWSIPVASGESYKLDDGVTIDCGKLGGTLR